MYKRYMISLFVWSLFLVSPMVSLLIALKSYKGPLVKNVLWAFIIFYGFNFVIYDEFMDANRYAERLVTLHRTEVGFDNFLGLFLSDDESSFLDAAGPLTTFLVSRFTESAAVLFGVYAMVFGFFYSRNVFFILDQAEGKLKTASWILLFVVCLTIPFWSINGFRFWTASQLFLYGMLPYLFGEKKKKYLLISACSVLFHFSFMIPVVILLMSRGFTKNLTVLYSLFLGSFLFNFIQLGPLQEFLMQYAPDFLHTKLHTYVNENYAGNLEAAQETTKWFVLFKSELIRYFGLVLISVLYFLNRNYVKSNPLLLDVFCMILYFSIINNVIASIPSVGRFQVLNYFLLYTFALLMIQNAAEEFIWLKRIVYLGAPMLAVFIVFQLRIGFQTINILTITGNPFLCIGEKGKAVLDFFKQ
ncbi:hypothetical protein DBR11_00670 [Pedobacter sp. HMWF019]|uniref:EpsG family protein n=1 Tax=Pedobacter sp. HMWF019 TaxID=2056856 RepID=UPI000D34B72A|nr:EpsG family protein [Pedobacter sp. HMWF019]PTT04029.1 hypothetical protein DBR11_00670 [Pedobacter sp. HMWF019]